MFTGIDCLIHHQYIVQANPGSYTDFLITLQGRIVKLPIGIDVAFEDIVLNGTALQIQGLAFQRINLCNDF